MTYWVDRTASLKPGQPVTHALVIGVSAYDHLPGGPLTFGLKSLSSTAAGAHRFAVWLRDHYHNPRAPLATIRLLLSPTAEGEPADREHVRNAVLGWQEDNYRNSSGTSFLYAAGHGVMLSHEDSLVLLQDFAKDRMVLDYSLDIGSVYHGMAGDQFPQSQVYFVDACRLRPEVFARFANLGTGVGLPSPFAAADRRSSSVYFSAAPGTLAYGRRDGEGTIFSAALLDCLGGLAVEAAGAGEFHVTGASLLRTLQEQVNSRARQYNAEQYVTGGGTGLSHVVHYFERPPAFPYAIWLDPDHARPFVRAEIWDGDRNGLLADGRFEPNPASWDLPAGLHSLDVIVKPGDNRFRTRSGVALLVDGRQARPKVVSVE
ncbi:caspase family protein [Actinoplanes sp. NPDC048988]|uniref:caspase family protein n=1 Tax=Actinoplanes sp. NPDC048988 TaxID=3363901 RepID=UPI003715B40B